MLRSVCLAAAAAAVLLALAVPAFGVTVPDTDDRWTPMTVPGATGSFWSMDFPDASAGWVAGPAGVARTVDGGGSWSIVWPAGDELNDVCATDADHAWVTGRRGSYPNAVIFVASTSDGGKTWSEKDFPTTPTEDRPGGIEFADDEHGYAAMARKLYQTTDGGVTWTASSLTWRPGVIEVLDAQRAWVLASDPVTQAIHIWKTVDGGAEWTDLGAPDWSASGSSRMGGSDLQFTDQDHGFLLSDYRYATTDDGGASWQWHTTPWFFQRAMCAVDPLHLWFANSDGVFATDDGGTTWVRQMQPEYRTLTQIAIVGDSGWVVGNALFRTDHNGRSDLYAPVTTHDAPSFIKTPVTVHLTSVDEGSGVAGTWYRVDGGVWQAGTSLQLDGSTLPEGTHVVGYASRDTYGNWELGKSFGVRVDRTGPSVKVDFGFYQPGTWTNQECTFDVTALENEADSGADAAYLKVDDFEWQRRLPLFHSLVEAPSDHSNDGAHSVAVYGVDKLGNVSATKQYDVAIDTRRPKATTGYVAHGQSRGLGSLRFKVRDARPCARACQVVITVSTLKGKKLGVMTPPVWFVTDRYVTVKFTCPLKAGKYKFSVTAVDGAGNVTARPAWNYLVVSAARGSAARAAPDVLELLPPTTKAPATSHAPVGVVAVP